MNEQTATPTLREIADYLRRTVGERIAAAIAGIPNAERISRYALEGSPRPGQVEERRLREGYAAVKNLVDSYDAETARVWLFGTNSFLDGRAPVEVLGESTETVDLAAVVAAARAIGTPDR